MLFATALTYKSVYKIYLIVSDSDRGKDIVALLLDFLCNHFDDSGEVHDLICSDRSCSIIQSGWKKTFLLKIFVKSYGKEIADGIGGKAKSLVWPESSRAATKQREVIHI